MLDRLSFSVFKCLLGKRLCTEVADSGANNNLEARSIGIQHIYEINSLMTFIYMYVHIYVSHFREEPKDIILYN